LSLVTCVQKSNRKPNTPHTATLHSSTERAPESPVLQVHTCSNIIPRLHRHDSIKYSIIVTRSHGLRTPTLKQTFASSSLIYCLELILRNLCNLFERKKRKNEEKTFWHGSRKVEFLPVKAVKPTCLIGKFPHKRKHEDSTVSSQTSPAE